MSFGILKIFERKNQIPEGTDILLTGIPRSGTTLACRLLNHAENVIALNEPIEPTNFMSRENAHKRIKSAIHEFRLMLYNTGMAPSKHKDGVFVDNNFSQEPGTRKRIVVRSPLSFGEPRRKPFTLVLKHNAEFTQLLPELMNEFSVFAIVRNPLAVIISWRTVEIPVSKGRISKSQWLSPEFHQMLLQKKDLLDRQLFILDWYFRQFKALPTSHVIRYEEMINTGGKILCKIADNNLPFDPNLKDMHRLPPGGLPEANILLDKLMKYQGSWLDDYSETDIKEYLDHLSKLK